ncbi:hypothetical protein [Streptomyces sp. NPDC003554]
MDLALYGADTRAGDHGLPELGRVHRVQPPLRTVQPHARGRGSAAVVATMTALRTVLPSSTNTNSVGS